MPEPPFGHSELLKSNRLHSLKSVADGLSEVFKTPCVVFCGHPSLRCGDAVHFMEVWGSGNQNSVIFIEPSFSLAQVLAPYQPLAMKAFWCPIDPRLDFSQAKRLIRDLQPRHTVIPEAYLYSPLTMPQRTDLQLELEGPVSTFTRCDAVSLNLDAKFTKATVASELAASLVPHEIHPGVAAATVQGSLHSYDNRHTLKPWPQSKSFISGWVGDNNDKSEWEEGEIQDHKRKQRQRLIGELSVDTLVQELSRHGVAPLQVETTNQGQRIIAGDASILIQEGSLHVVAPATSKSRLQISKCLLSQLCAI